tara:strand:+ start:231 stop:479 length:249 start_codon:yes stop_codon:yes gene_type:complete
VIEGEANERLALFGTIGQGRVFMITNEPRFDQVTETGQGPPGIQVPDTPLDLFEAALPGAGQPILFQSITRRACCFSLTKSE